MGCSRADRTLDRADSFRDGHAMRLVLTLVLASSLVAACSVFGSSGDVTMCDVAGSLSAARTLVEQAAAKDASGDKAGAQQLAGQAAVLAKQGHDLLQTITSSDVMGGDTWQALLGAYLHVGQAANALLPAYANTYGMTDEELATASKQLQAATAGLPARCFMATSLHGVGAPTAGASG